MKKLDHPINRCTIDVTENCNLRCGYCFTFFNKNYKRKDLSITRGKEIIDFLLKEEISQSDIIDINWWGGEPFYKFDTLKTLTDYALERTQKLGLRLSIGGTSNVTLWDKKVVDWMNQHRSYFMMSIDGPKDVQDNNRPAENGKSSWGMIEKNLPYIMQQIPFANSRMSPTPKHIGRMHDTFQMLYTRFKIKTQMFSPVYEVEWSDDKLKIAKEELIKICEMIIRIRKSGGEFNVKHLDDYAGKIESGKSTPQFPCGAGRFYVGFSTNGDIYPCHRFNKYNNGKAKEKDKIGDIKRGITNPEFRQQFTNWFDNPFPKKCTEECELYGNLCDMSCYAVSYDLTGKIYTPHETYCRWEHMFAEVAKYYHKRLKEENLPILGMNNGGNMGQQSCNCNNMCFLEGSENEIITVDPNSDATCICNSTNYNGSLNDTARKLTNTERNELLGKMEKHAKSETSFSPEGKQLMEKMITLLEEDNKLKIDLMNVLQKLSDKL